MASQRVVKVETFLDPAWLCLYSLASRLSLNIPTRLSPLFRYCTPSPCSFPSWLQLPSDFMQSQVRLYESPSFFSFPLLPMRWINIASSSSLRSLMCYRVILGLFVAIFFKKVRGEMKAGSVKALPRVEANRLTSFCSLMVQSALKKSIFLSYLLANLLLAAREPSCLSAHLSTILIFHCTLTLSQRDDSLLVLGSRVLSWSSFFDSSITQKRLFLLSITATSRDHSTPPRFRLLLIRNVFISSLCTATIPTGRFCSKAPYITYPAAVLRKESPLIMLALQCDSMKLNSSSIAMPTPSKACCSARVWLWKQPWKTALRQSPVSLYLPLYLSLIIIIPTSEAHLWRIAISRADCS